MARNEIKSTESYSNFVNESGSNTVQKDCGMNDRSDRSWHDSENNVGGGDACAIQQNGYGNDPFKGGKR